MDTKVNDYIERQNSPQKEILQKVRKIFKETLPNSEEKMAWGVITFGAGKFYLAAMRTRVHIGFSITGLSDEEKLMFEGNGKTMRHIKIPTIESLDEANLVSLIRMVDQKVVCKPCYESRRRSK